MKEANANCKRSLLPLPLMRRRLPPDQLRLRRAGHAHALHHQLQRGHNGRSGSAAVAGGTRRGGDLRAGGACALLCCSSIVPAAPVASPQHSQQKDGVPVNDSSNTLLSLLFAAGGLPGACSCALRIMIGSRLLLVAAQGGGGGRAIRQAVKSAPPPRHLCVVTRTTTRRVRSRRHAQVRLNTRPS